MNRIVPWVKTLRARLLATYLGLILLGFGGLTLLAGWQIANSAYTDFANALQVNAILLAANLAGPLHDGHDGDDYRAMSQSVGEMVQRTAESVQARVLLIDRNGRVFLDSQSPQMLPLREEGLGAVRQWAADANYHFANDETGTKQLVVSTVLRSEERQIGYLQLSAPATQPQTMVRNRWWALGGGFLLFALVGTAISLWLLSTLIRPLQSLRATALAMAAGDLTQRVPNPAQDEIGAVGNAFNQMATQVEAMVAEQRAFAGNASHELRTPLTTLRLRTEALMNNHLDPATSRQYIAEMDREVTRMNGLVDDLILLSRLDANRLAVGEELVDMGRVVRSVQQELAATIADKALTITIEQPTSPLPPVQANLNHLRVVVRNLLENGVKYTPAGGAIGVSLSYGCDENQRFHLAETVGSHTGRSMREENGRICCRVSDNGVGIALEELPHVHKRFHRAALARQRTTVQASETVDEHDGTGLGLALVDSIVTLYGGRFEITSPGLGQGTTATVWWPVVQEDE